MECQALAFSNILSNYRYCHACKEFIKQTLKENANKTMNTLAFQTESQRNESFGFSDLLLLLIYFCLFIYILT